jgi:TonB family protein
VLPLIIVSTARSIVSAGDSRTVVRSVAFDVVGRCTLPAAQLRLGEHMSVEASQLMSEVWPTWQGHVINGVYPLGRYLGGSDHSGVFLTKAAAQGPSEVVVKLVPTNRALVESQLPRWKRAGGLAHPHLLRLLEWGGCQLDGLPYLYTVMEYADQTLAQLLLLRALTDDEAREMLLPTLEVLAFLHGRNLVQGQLKPANILVVGDQLKLASDSIRRVSEATLSTDSSTVYDPPEARHGGSSTAGDIWALGVSLFEALTRSPPSGLSEPKEAIVLPPDFSPAFRNIVTGCLSPSPQDRPTATQLMDWIGGRSAGSAPAATIQPAAAVSPEPKSPEPAPPRTSPQISPEAARPALSVAQSPKPRAFLTAMAGAIVILALGWAGVRMLSTHRAPSPPPVQATGESPSQAPRAVAPAIAEAQAPVSAVSTRKPGQSDETTSPLALLEVIPDVARSARQTIRGHIKVWVRVIVNQDGSVYDAIADRTGPSRYFQQLAIEAAKKWTFSPVRTPSQRLLQVRFDFSRDGTTGRAVTLH